MGGFGSGRGEWDEKKNTVEECFALDVNWLARYGNLDDGRHALATVWRCGSPAGSVDCEVLDMDGHCGYLQLRYTRHGHDVVLGIQLVTTTPHLGGVRWWFLCPHRADGEQCGGRVAKLYSPPNGLYFGCRQCYDLTYQSCQMSRKDDGWMGRFQRDPDLMTRIAEQRRSRQRR